MCLDLSQLVRSTPFYPIWIPTMLHRPSNIVIIFEYNIFPHLLVGLCLVCHVNEKKQITTEFINIHNFFVVPLLNIQQANYWISSGSHTCHLLSFSSKQMLCWIYYHHHHWLFCKLCQTVHKTNPLETVRQQLPPPANPTQDLPSLFFAPNFKCYHPFSCSNWV